MSNLIALISGIIFSIGLILSGMINPDKVIGFLDLFGKWDYALALVMGGAVIFNLISFRVILKKKTPLLCKDFSLPTKSTVDKNLVMGSAIFGIGWGLIGICPGPAIVNLAMGEVKIVVFIASMLIGMKSYKFISTKLKL